jgi:hypothetical protein
MSGNILGTISSLSGAALSALPYYSALKTSTIATSNRIGLYGSRSTTILANEATSAQKYVAKPTLDSVRKLNEFGFNVADRKAFFQGKHVDFFDYGSQSTVFPTQSLLQFEGNTLRVGISNIESTGTGALPNFINRSRALAKSLSATQLEIVGADIHNTRLYDAMLRKGYEPGEWIKINIDGGLIGVPTLRKTFNLSLEDLNLPHNSNRPG